MSAIEITGITKRFGSLVAVDNVSLSVKQGEIFGLLGPNGAGKTTLISMLVTMRRPDAGSATVNGFDVSKNPHEVRKSIGIGAARCDVRGGLKSI
ncbi:MAG: ATP-binding cassette domain-containing protein [Candidatus Bilamarchaeaceae archaeon]